MTGNPYQMLKEATERCGWSESSKVLILLEYIEKQDNDAAFGDYLEECIREEVDQEEAEA